MDELFGFYKGRKVFVTGCSGFKGAWICQLLLELGAEVSGYSLEPPTDPSLFEILNLSNKIHYVCGDINNYELLKRTMNECNPEVVIHMAAQPIVRESYRNPVYTYQTNVMGTVNLLDCCRYTDSVRSVINVTTDKVYKNNEWAWGYRETDELNGYDPYSNSKSCSELVTDTYSKCFLDSRGIVVSTLRAGNVIGGGDFAADRIIPDCVRAMSNEEKKIIIRNPYSIRPFQHVLDPIIAYLMIAMTQYNDNNVKGSYNVGPDESDCVKVGELAEMFCKQWGDGADWVDVSEENAPHEARFLKLDCSKIKSVFGWKPIIKISEALEKTVAWSKEYINGSDMGKITSEQIKNVLNRRGQL